VIYFLRCERDFEIASGEVLKGWVKIGTTTRLSFRLKEIAAKIGHEPTLLGILDGGFAEEKAIHDRYSGFRRCGEWFNPEHSNLFKLIAEEARPWDGVDEAGLFDMKPVKADRAMIAKAKYVAEMKGIPLAEYVTDVMKTQVERDFAKVVRENGGSPTATDVK
jgi:hypothetical protein